MIGGTVRRLRKLTKNNQKGFTLIEMLVVISILGILAAVVTISMIGVTSLAQGNANKTELKAVQVAMDTMATQQQMDTNTVCGTSTATSQSTATNDMTQFPVSAASAAPGSPTALSPLYLRQNTLHNGAKYWCDANGTVHSTAVQGS